MTIQPTHHRILIRVTKSDSSIVRPEDTSPLSNDAIMIEAVGPDVTCCKEGDRVLLHPDARNFIGIERDPDDNWFTAVISDDIVVAVVVPELEVVE